MQRCQAEEDEEVMAEVAVAVVEVEVQGDPHHNQEVTMMMTTTRAVNQTRWNSHHTVQERHKVQQKWNTAQKKIHGNIWVLPL